MSHRPMNCLSYCHVTAWRDFVLFWLVWNYTIPTDILKTRMTLLPKNWIVIRLPQKSLEETMSSNLFWDKFVVNDFILFENNKSTPSALTTPWWIMIGFLVAWKIIFGNKVLLPGKWGGGLVWDPGDLVGWGLWRHTYLSHSFLEWKFAKKIDIFLCP